MERLKNGDIVRHFKFETLTADEKKSLKFTYVIITQAVHTETLENMVVYKALYEPFTVFTRPADMFYAEVNNDKYPYIKQKYVFERTKLTEQQHESIKHILPKQ